MNAEEYKKLSPPESYKDFLTAVDNDFKYSSAHGASAGLIIFGAIVVGSTVLFSLVNYFGPLVNSPGSARPRISMGEMLITGVLGILIVALGVILRTAYNGMRTKLALEALKFQAELNAQLNAERLAVVKPQPKSNGDAAANTKP